MRKTMNIHTSQIESSFASVLEELGLNGSVPAPDAAASSALRRYLAMYKLLEPANEMGPVKKGVASREYLAAMRDFEQSISKVRFLRRVEMAHSKRWDFGEYLRGTIIFAQCRCALRLAYVCHLLKICDAPRMAQSAGSKMFGSIFFEPCGLSAHS